MNSNTATAPDQAKRPTRPGATALLAAALGATALLSSCTFHHEITIKDPIIVEVLVKVDNDLNNYFGEIDAAK